MIYVTLFLMCQKASFCGLFFKFPRTFNFLPHCAVEEVGKALCSTSCDLISVGNKWEEAVLFQRVYHLKGVQAFTRDMTCHVQMCWATFTAIMGLRDREPQVGHT